MIFSSRTTGKQYEQQARTYLEAHGLKWQISNYQCRFGEIDLIMLDSNQLVFVEVRYRRNANYGSPAETITRKKQEKIIRTAQHFLQSKQLSSQIGSRFDVISIDSQNSIQWVPNAFY